MNNHADLEDLVKLERTCFSDPWSERALAEGLANDRYLILLEANDNSEAIGYLIGWHIGDEAELARIGVVPEARRSGYGKVLLEKAIVTWQERGVSRIFLEVRQDNMAAQRLYESRGFRIIGKRAKYYADGTNALILELPLGPAEAELGKTISTVSP